MDVYSLLKFLHVACVIMWLGAGLCLVFLGIVADLQGDKEGFGRVLQHVIFMSPRVFIPTSLAALVFGATAAFLDWGFGNLWIVLGLVGFVVTFLTGILILAPSSAKITAMIAREGFSEAVVVSGRELLNHAKFDFVVLFAVVFDMVLKPTLSDWPALAVMVVALIVGAVVFLMPGMVRARVPAGA